MKKDYYSLRTPGSIGKCNKITIKARTTRAFAKWMLVPRVSVILYYCVEEIVTNK